MCEVEVVVRPQHFTAGGELKLAAPHPGGRVVDRVAPRGKFRGPTVDVGPHLRDEEVVEFGRPARVESEPARACRAVECRGGRRGCSPEAFISSVVLDVAWMRAAAGFRTDPGRENGFGAHR